MMKIIGGVVAILAAMMAWVAALGFFGEVVQWAVIVLMGAGIFWSIRGDDNV
jgi:uncharacterized membrane protein